MSSRARRGARPCRHHGRRRAAVRHRRANRSSGKPSGSLRQAGPHSEATTLPAASSRDRLRRSRLYLPGNEPKYFINAGLHAPDAVILDLEDSVHFAEKDPPECWFAMLCATVDFGCAERMVRINQLPLGLTDLEEIVPQSPDLILIPKVEIPQQIVEVDRPHPRHLQAMRHDSSHLADADPGIRTRN